MKYKTQVLEQQGKYNKFDSQNKKRQNHLYIR